MLFVFILYPPRSPCRRFNVLQPNEKHILIKIQVSNLVNVSLDTLSSKDPSHHLSENTKLLDFIASLFSQ